MKKRLFCYLFAAFCAAVVLPSCGEDEPGPDYTQAIEEEISGDYKGTLAVTVAGAAAPVTSQNITVSKASATAIDLTISNFSFSGMSLGDVVLKNCELQQDGDVYTCQREEELALPDPVGTCPVASNITIANGEVTVTLDITVPALNDQVVKVVYEGIKLTGTEKTEAAILSFTFDTANEANACVIEQPVINDDKTITFRVNADAVEADPDMLKGLIPTITVSEGATLSPAGGVATDFSSNVTYTVLSEDGKTTATYTVNAPVQNKQMKFTFDDGWTEVTETLGSYLTPNPADLLATSNGGAALIAESLGGYPVVEEENGYVGKAVKLITYDSRETIAGSLMGIGVTSGSLFTGKFAFGDGNETIEYTKFGVVYASKPLTFKGAYKYTPGTPFINGKGTGSMITGMNFEITDDIDECSIQAVLYEVSSGTETLDGTNINNSDKIVAVAALQDGSAKADWTTFEIPFTWEEGKTYDKTKMYKLAIVCSSSKAGDLFKGAANSTLWVDELEVIGE